MQCVLANQSELGLSLLSKNAWQNSWWTFYLILFRALLSRYSKHNLLTEQMIRCCAWSICNQEGRREAGSHPQGAKQRYSFLTGQMEGQPDLLLRTAIWKTFSTNWPLPYMHHHFPLSKCTRSALYDTPDEEIHGNKRNSLVNNWIYWGKTLYNCMLLQWNWNSIMPSTSPGNISKVRRMGITSKHWHRDMTRVCTREFFCSHTEKQCCSISTQNAKKAVALMWSVRLL